MSKIMRRHTVDNYYVDKIASALNTILIRRLLARYFVGKGFGDNFDEPVYPPDVQDLAESMPELSGLIEVAAHVESLDPTTGSAVIGWSLFVLGNQRLSMGETDHEKLTDLENMNSGLSTNVSAESGKNFRRPTTPRKIVAFVTRVLSGSKAGFIRAVNPEMANGSMSKVSRTAAGTASSGFFERNKPARIE